MDTDQAVELPDDLGLYLKLGWPLIPIHTVTDERCSCGKGAACTRAGKHPRTKRGLKDASTDPEQIAKWLADAPNWAVRTGDGLFVVDVDNLDSLTELEDLPDTITTITGGGGQHYWYAAPHGVHIHNSVSKLAPGIDIRGDGGYVLVPPSGHRSGNAYAWDAHPDDTPLAAAPQWLLDRIADLRPVDGATDGAVPAGTDGAIAGGRNQYLTGIAGAMRRKGCEASAIKSALMMQNMASCHPPLDEAEVTKIADSVSQYDPSDVDGVGGWVGDLTTDRHGNLTKERTNVAIILTHHSEWKGALRYDMFASRLYWAKDAPKLDSIVTPVAGDDFADWHETPINQWFLQNYGVSFTKDAIFGGMEAAARTHEFDPLLDYLNGLKWDGKKRLHKWLHAYMGARDEDYATKVGTWWMISAVARAMSPGCQADHMLVLEGPQGIGKSTATGILCSEQWFLGSLPDIRNKDALDALAGHWIVEIAELDALKGANATRVKEFVSQSIDEFRPAYGRFTVKRPRRCVFVGTTNEMAYLTDTTGARRFWPVRCGAIDRKKLARDRDQLWAEAVRMFKDGVIWWPGLDDEKALDNAQEKRQEVDDWEDPISSWVQGRDEVTASDVFRLALNMPEIKDMDRRSQTRVGKCMHRLGYIKKRRKGVDGVRRHYYVKFEYES